MVQRVQHNLDNVATKQDKNCFAVTSTSECALHPGATSYQPWQVDAQKVTASEPSEEIGPSTVSYPTLLAMNVSQAKPINWVLFSPDTRVPWQRQAAPVSGKKKRAGLLNSSSWMHRCMKRDLGDRTTNSYKAHQTAHAYVIGPGLDGMLHRMLWPTNTVVVDGNSVVGLALSKQARVRLGVTESVAPSETKRRETDEVTTFQVSLATWGSHCRGHNHPRADSGTKVGKAPTLCLRRNGTLQKGAG